MNGKMNGQAPTDLQQVMLLKKAQETFGKAVSELHDGLKRHDPAHPVQLSISSQNFGTASCYDPGLSKLDHFAGLAMQSLVAHGEYQRPRELIGQSGEVVGRTTADQTQALCRDAYLIAASMIEARKPYLPKEEEPKKEEAGA